MDSAVTSSAYSSESCDMISLSASLANSTDSGTFSRSARARVLMRHPSSSLMLVVTRSAINMATSSGSGLFPSSSFFFLRIAILVSTSGGSMTVISPHSNLDLNLSSRAAMSRGCLSLVRTICFSALRRALKVLKNSSCVPGFALIN